MQTSNGKTILRATALIAAVVLLLGWLLPGAVGTAYAAPAITPARSALAAGDQFAVNGAGFAAGDNVVVFADFTVDGSARRAQATATASASGAFHVTLTVPAGTAAGTYRLNARDFHGHTATQYITVLPLVQLTAGSQAGTITVLAGHYFLVRGAGFKGGETVHITASFPLYNGSTVNVSKSVTADAGGAFGELALQAPWNAKATTVAVAAKGATGGKTASASVAVAYRPAVALNPTTLRPGGSATIDGSGFVPGATVHVTVKIPRQNGGAVTLSKDATVGDRGRFTTSLTVPTGTVPGGYTLTATGATAGFHAGARLTVTLNPVIAVLPSSLMPGHSVSVQGSGFSAGATVTLTSIVPLYGGGTHTVSQTVQTDAAGNFSTHLGIPGQAAAGVVTIVATGPGGQSKGSVSIQHILARISVAPTPLRPGSTATVTGSGYPAGDHVAVSASVKLPNGTTRVLSTSAVADSAGKFTATLAVPSEVVAGTYALTARSESTGRTPSARLLVAVAAQMALQPAAVSPGGTTTINGHGFSGGVTVAVSANVALYGGGSKVISTTARTDAAGTFAVKLAIPGNAAAGTVTVVARGPHTATGARLQVGKVPATVTLSAASIIPGTTLTLQGAGYPAGDSIQIAVAVHTAQGTTRTLTATVRTDGKGAFSAALTVPADVAAGTYTVVARSTATGRAPHAQFTVVKLVPSLVAAPATTAPGTQVAASGFGFAAGEAVSLTLNGKTVGSATTGGNGKFSVKVPLAADLSTGAYSLVATGNAGHRAAANLTINRAISTHFYFASLFTGPGHEDDLAFVNPSTIRAQVKITYQRSNGAPVVKTVNVNPTSRFTESVNADLGSKVSAAASVAADVPIGAALIAYQGNEGSVIPGSRRPSTIWYFANGNTSGQYREYIALQNSNNGSIRAVIHLFPTHHRAITLYRTMGPSSRTTLYVNRFVRDAVGVTVTANAPIVVNRTVKIRHGIASKNGVTAPQRTWYFAAGPRDPNARHWIGLVNPTGNPAYVTVRAYGPLGRNLGATQGWLRAGGRVGYLINRLAHQADAAVVITASRPVVAEQTTYIGGRHDAATDAFGVTAPARSWAYAAVTTANARQAQDYLDLFNPNLTPLPVVVQFMPSSGAPTQRTYVIGPLAHLRVDVGSVVPNADLGILATSNQPFVGLNRTFFQGRMGATTSQGEQP